MTPRDKKTTCFGAFLSCCSKIQQSQCLSVIVKKVDRFTTLGLSWRNDCFFIANTTETVVGNLNCVCVNISIAVSLPILIPPTCTPLNVDFHFYKAICIIVDRVWRQHKCFTKSRPQASIRIAAMEKVGPSISMSATNIFERKIIFSSSVAYS